MPPPVSHCENHPARKRSAAGFFRYSGWCLLPALMLAASCGKPDEATDGPAETRSSHSRDTDAGGNDVPGENLRDALQRAAEIENPNERQEALAAIAWRAVADDPELAREALARLPPGASGQRTGLVRHLAMQMAHDDIDAALAWADGLPGERETALARSRIALVVADTDPRRAATMLAESGDAGRERDVAIVQVLQHWTATEPASAADWLAMFPAGNFRKAGMEAVISRWLAADPPAAMGWLSSLDAGELRSEAMTTTAGLLARQPAETREAWLDAADDATRAAMQDASAR